jgi:hypothetical protein
MLGKVHVRPDGVMWKAVPGVVPKLWVSHVNCDTTVTATDFVSLQALEPYAFSALTR